MIFCFLGRFSEGEELIMSRETQMDERVACDACGRFGAFTFGERHLCVDCYEECGSCCLEFGGDDLWSFPEEQAEPAEAGNPKSER